MTVSSTSKVSPRLGVLICTLLLMVGASPTTLAVGPAQAAWSQDCRLDGTAETCGRPDWTAPPACDWECKQILREERQRWKEKKAERKRQQAIYDQQMRDWRQEQARIARANLLIDRSNALIEKSKKAWAAGRYDEELKLLRAALAVHRSPVTRLNVMRPLAYDSYKLARAKITYGDYSHIADLQKALAEIRSLDGIELSSLSDYANVKLQADGLADAIIVLQTGAAQAEQAKRIAAEQQALAKAREKQALIDAAEQKKLAEAQSRAELAANDRANGFVDKAVIAGRAGRYAEELMHLRSALSMFPADPTFRLNVMNFLAHHVANDAADSIDAGDFSRIEEYQRSVDEIAKLNGTDLAGLEDYPALMTDLNILKQNILELRGAQFQQQEASRVARQQTATGRAAAAQPSSADMQLNPAALTEQAAAIATGPGRERGSPSKTAMEALERLTDGNTKTGPVIDGGSGAMDSQARAPAGVGEIVGGRVISQADLAEYNKSAAFREADGKIQVAIVARRTADDQRQNLARQQELAKAGLAPPPSQAKVDQADRAARAAREVERQANQARDAVIKKLEEARDPIFPDEE